MQEGDILRAAHHNEEALAAYQRVWKAGRAGAFPLGGYEIAAIRMGDLQRSQQENAKALASYSLLKMPGTPRRTPATGARVSWANLRFPGEERSCCRKIPRCGRDRRI